MDETKTDNLIHLRTGITIYPSHDQAIEGLLDEFMSRCPAVFILLVDTTGLQIASRGDVSGMDLTALGSLVAADLAASQEITRITGHDRNNQLILREGTQINTFVCEAGRELALFIQVSRDVPLGWARLLIRGLSGQLSEIIATPAEHLDELDLGLGDKQLSDLAEEALDSMWS